MGRGGRDHEYPEDVRELAYQLWAYVCGRKVYKIPRAAESPEWADLVAGRQLPPLDTLHDWVRRFDWRERADREIHAIAPDLRLHTQQALAIGVPEAAQFLREVVRDDAVDVKVRVTAALGLLDRGGFSPVGTKLGLGEVDTPRSLSAVVGDMAGATWEDLVSVERRLRESRQQHGERGKVTGLAR